MTKKDKILKHLQLYDTITSWEAIQEYGVTRLSAIIFTLRKEGFEIDSEKIQFTDRFGDTSNFSKYIFKGKVQ